MPRKTTAFQKLRERLERLNERQREIVEEKRQLIVRLQAACPHDPRVADICEAEFDQIWINNADADPVYPARLCSACGLEEQLTTSESFDHLYKTLNCRAVVRMSRDQYDERKARVFALLGID